MPYDRDLTDFRTASPTNETDVEDRESRTVRTVETPPTKLPLYYVRWKTPNGGVFVTFTTSDQSVADVITRLSDQPNQNLTLDSVQRVDATSLPSFVTRDRNRGRYVEKVVVPVDVWRDVEPFVAAVYPDAYTAIVSYNQERLIRERIRVAKSRGKPDRTTEKNEGDERERKR
jgi:hypothetical protein